MRIFTQEDLKDCSRMNLERKLNMVKTSADLTEKEIHLNVCEIELALNGGVHCPMSEVIKDIQAGEPDTDDISGH